MIGAVCTLDLMGTESAESLLESKEEDDLILAEPYSRPMCTLAKRQKAAKTRV